MCLGIPGKIIDIYYSGPMRMCKVDFGGVIREVCVEALPEAKNGDFTIVHAGFALNILSEDEAAETLDLLDVIFNEEEQINFVSGDRVSRDN